MRTFQHSKQASFFNQLNSEQEDFKLKIICEDGTVICERLLFILWSKQWREVLNPDEEISVLIFPDVKQRTMQLLLDLLKKGDIMGLESDFDDFFGLALDFLSDFPGGFSNFETSDKALEDKATSLRTKRKKQNQFKTC